MPPAKMPCSGSLESIVDRVAMEGQGIAVEVIVEGLEGSMEYASSPELSVRYVWLVWRVRGLDVLCGEVTTTRQDKVRFLAIESMREGYERLLEAGKRYILIVGQHAGWLLLTGPLYAMPIEGDDVVIQCSKAFHDRDYRQPVALVRSALRSAGF